MPCRCQGDLSGVEEPDVSRIISVVDQQMLHKETTRLGGPFFDFLLAYCAAVKLAFFANFLSTVRLTGGVEGRPASLLPSRAPVTKIHR